MHERFDDRLMRMERNPILLTLVLNPRLDSPALAQGTRTFLFETLKPVMTEILVRNGQKGDRSMRGSSTTGSFSLVARCSKLSHR